MVVLPEPGEASKDCNLNSNLRFVLPVVLGIKNANAEPGSPVELVCRTPRALLELAFCALVEALDVNPVADA